jgi:hypothetical protein
MKKPSINQNILLLTQKLLLDFCSNNCDILFSRTVTSTGGLKKVRHRQPRHQALPAPSAWTRSYITLSLLSLLFLTFTCSPAPFAHPIMLGGGGRFALIFVKIVSFVFL